MPSENKKIFERLISKTKIYLVIIAVLLIIICSFNISYILPSILVYALILLYAYWSNNKRKSELKEHIRDLTFSMDKTAKSTLINTPFPLVIIETNGNTIWKSNKFNEEFANIDINNIIENLVKEIKLELENNQANINNEIVKDVKIEEKTYKVIGKCTKSKEEYILTLYFIDNTEFELIKNKYNDSKICVGIVMIDNYEEIFQRISDEDKPQLIAKIEKSIYEWGNLFEALVIKSERDTYVICLEQKNLEELKESKFKVLDTIKEIETSDKAPITLSIAIANEGDSNYEKYKLAQASIDIALGRGGDQAVIRENGKYVFFGGRAQELEKRTKVKARMISHALEELILESKDVMIMGHANGDIDSMGASMGIYRLAKTLEKDVYIVNNSYGISLENFIDTAKQDKEYEKIIINKQEAMSKISEETLLVIVDTHKRTYVEVPELLTKTKKIVIIDHHRKSPDFIDEAILSFHEVYASSASELVTEILEYSDKTVELAQIEAEALYAGIKKKTKNFTFKTGVRTFEAAAYLRKCGVDIIKVKKWFQSDLKTYNKISRIVERAEVVNESIAISINDEEDKDANIICAKAADELLTISDITASFVIGKIGDKVYISGRSIGDINVQVILEKLGGGGHITLAGAQVEGMTEEEVKQELINRINEYFSEISS